MLTLLQQATAQDRNVSGRVTDRQTGEGLPGVTVLLKGSTNGISTNSDGTFTLTVPSTGGTLVFSSIGYIQIEREIGQNSQVNVALAGDTKQLSEVVVTGYGTQERRDVTGSISSVKGEEIANLATPSFDQQLAGRAAGVQVTTPSGILGQAPRIRIRGTNSISSGASPLIVVDGIPVITGNQSGVTPNNPLGDINPADIESYEVLKDGSSTAIYGSRAANGVILITTKKGKLGKATISYDNWLGIAETTKRYDVLNADQFIEINNEKFANAGQAPQAFPYAEGSNVLNTSTDWQDLIFRKGFQQNHVVSVAGATEKTNYYFSVGYTDQEAVILGNSLKRATFRSNLNQEVASWLNIGMNLGLTRNENQGLNTGRNGLSGNVTNALSVFPNIPARNPDGTPYISTASPALIGRGSNTQNIAFNYPNVLFAIENNKYEATNYRILGNVFAEAVPFEGLRLRTQYGADLFLNNDFQFNDPRHGDGLGNGGLVFQQFAPTQRWNWSNTASYDKIFSDVHKIGAVIGVEYQKTRTQSYSATGTGLADRFFGSEGLINNTIGTPTVGGSFAETGFDSYFGRINYSFKDRYLLSATVRNDAISALPENNRRGYFPGGSVGWRISQEPFFKGSALGAIVSDLKIRASYAQVGNVEIGNYPYQNLFGPAKYGTQNGIGYGANIGSNIGGQLGNQNLRWESSNKKDIGIDLGFLDDRFTLTADYYRNDIDDLILGVPTPVSLGIPNNRYFDNIGAMRNEGFELGINTQNISNEDFNWTTNINFATNKNEVLELNNNEDILFPYNINRVGESIGALYGYDYQGVNAANGNPIYRKGDGTFVQGNVDNSQYYAYDPSNPGSPIVFGNANAALNTPTSSLSAAQDRFILGNTNPTWFGGVNNSFSYKGLDLAIFFRFSGGNKIMNVTRQQLLRQEFLNNGTEILDRWTTPGQVTNVPKLRSLSSDFVNLNNASVTRFVEKGDFLRLQNVTLGYTLPKQVVGVAALSRVRIYGQVQNAFTVSKYSGVDPEVDSNGNSTTNTTANSEVGVDFNSNPQQRVYTVGLNVAF
jgi:TonB-linked SusC/RagA family outer membrane protein